MALESILEKMLWGSVMSCHSRRQVWIVFGPHVLSRGSALGLHPTVSGVPTPKLSRHNLGTTYKPKSSSAGFTSRAGPIFDRPEIASNATDVRLEIAGLVTTTPGPPLAFRARRKQLAEGVSALNQQNNNFYPAPTPHTPDPKISCWT